MASIASYSAAYATHWAALTTRILTMRVAVDMIIAWVPRQTYACRGPEVEYRYPFGIGVLGVRSSGGRQSPGGSLNSPHFGISPRRCN